MNPEHSEVISYCAQEGSTKAVREITGTKHLPREYTECTTPETVLPQSQELL